MNANEESVNYMKTLLLATSSVIADMTNNLPVGCTRKMENGTYIANSIKDVRSLEHRVEAEDGFIKDGLLVMCEPANRFATPKNGNVKVHKAIFTLSGTNSGHYSIFVRTDCDYMSYMNSAIWKIESHEILFRHAEGDPRLDKKRVIKVPTIFNTDNGTYECKDRMYSVENKVDYLLDTRAFEEYECFIDDTIYDRDLKQFVEFTTIDGKIVITETVDKAI